MQVTDLSLRDFEMPIFNQDIEDAGNAPEAAKRLADLVPRRLVTPGGGVRSSSVYSRFLSSSPTVRCASM